MKEPLITKLLFLKVEGYCTYIIDIYTAFIKTKYKNGYLILCYAKLLQSCLTLCDPMDCSPQGSSLHGILQARILEWVAIPFSKGNS